MLIYKPHAIKYIYLLVYKYKWKIEIDGNTITAFDTDKRNKIIVENKHCIMNNNYTFIPFLYR